MSGDSSARFRVGDLKIYWAIAPGQHSIGVSVYIQRSTAADFGVHAFSELKTFSIDASASF